MASDGTITFSTALDNSQLEKDLKSTSEKIEQLQKKLEERESDRNAIAEALQAANEALDETEQKIAKLREQYADLEAAAAGGQLPMEVAQGRMEAISEELSSQIAKYSEQAQAGQEIAEIWNRNEQEIKDISKELDSAKAKEKTLAQEYSKSYGVAAANFNASMEKMNGRFDTFMGKITKRVKKLFVFSFIFGALSSLKKYLMAALEENQAFQASTAYLSATLAGLAAPVLKVVIPALTAVVNVITVMLTTLARLVDMIFKTNFLEQIAAARNAVSAQQQATDATNDQTKATKKLAKAKKEATRWLAAFDELNLAAKNEEDSDSEAESPLDNIGGVDGGAVAAAPWDGIDVGKIDEKLAEIMLILGAALLAVGAILAFSGINIPLGITLMAIGALMMYTAIAEQWETLPAEIKARLLTILEIIGGVLIVVGVILCLTGNIPLGIAFIIAGALLFVTAIALDWENLINNVDGALNALGLIIGAVIAVIGVVLLVTGHIPLGIAALIAGIAIFGISAANVEDGEVPARVQELIETVLDMLGPALVVLGIILCVVGMLPLGVAAIVAGIGVFAIRNVTISDETMQHIRGFVNNVLDFIKENALYVLAIGLILVAVGLFIPGIAAIIFGIWALVSPQTLDFDWILNTVKDIWDNIVNWFSTTVAPIFTTEWWADKFKSIANGLIDALNGALQGAGDFINNLAGGLSDILNFFGVEGWSFSITMPQIPRLAKGAVIPPNREFMAVLGDQPSGRNLEAPEGLLRQIVSEESGNAQMLAVLTQILQAVQNGHTLQCDGVTLAKVVNDRNAAGYKLYGW